MLKKKFLVIGGVGFVGSHLCKKLSQDRNNLVWSLDNYFTGSEKNHSKNVENIKGSSSDISNLIEFIPDVIFHLGEYSRVEKSFDDFDLLWDYNILGTRKVVEFASRNNCKLIYTGSSTKFGDKGNNRNESPYAWSKSSNTEFIINYSRWYNLNYAITYFYNVYGGNEISTGKYATLIGIFKNRMKNKLDLDVVSPGTQQRNFTYIDDIIDGLLLVGEKGKGDGYGIGSPESYSVLEIAKMFGGKITMIPERKGNRMTADLITKKTEQLGWKCKKSIINYINELKINNWL